MALGLPGISIVFKKVATDTMALGGASGIVALVIDDSSVSELTEYRIDSSSDIPVAISAENKGYIELALQGNPQELKVIAIPSVTGPEVLDISPALTYLETTKFNIVAAPGQITSYQTEISTWVKTLRGSGQKKVSCVVANVAGDHEGIWNFTTTNIKASDGSTYSAEEYIARVAGLIGGLSLAIAPTYQVFKDISSIPPKTKAELDAAIASGELVLLNDGEKVKIARGVTSLTTVGDDMSEGWKKIKLVRIYDKLYTDIKGALEDNYIGKVGNSYPNKILLIEAINTYLSDLEEMQLLHPKMNYCDIDIEAQKAYLISVGYLTDDGRNAMKMTEQEIREAKTDDKVFLKIKAMAVDAMEDVDIKVYV